MNGQPSEYASTPPLAEQSLASGTRHRAARIAVFIHSLSGGGAQRRAVTLANRFVARGRSVDLVTVKSDGPLRARLSPEIRVVALDVGDWDPAYVRIQPWLPTLTIKLLLSMRALERYLAQVRPDVLLSASNYVNLVAVVAWRRAGRPMPIVLRASNQLAGNLPVESWYVHLLRNRLRRIASRLYPEACAVIAVSNGVASEVVRVTGIPEERVRTIYNPVVTAELLQRSRAGVQHPWLDDPSVPVILGVGRLKPQKDFATLLRAFAIVRRARPARLIILGEGSLRARLVGLVERLGLQHDVQMPGFFENAPAWMARASLFVLSSLWEGLPSVLIEALAVGCPVVSTDCPSGPREILDGGRYGALVPCGDPQALADAILQTLRNPVARETLRERAAAFTGAEAPDQYLEVLDACIGQYRHAGVGNARGGATTGRGVGA